MGRISWNFYSRRRGAKLESFLRGVNSTAGAIDKFIKLGIIPPMDLIHEYFGNHALSDEPEKLTELIRHEQSKKDAEVTTENESAVSAYQEFDELIIIDPEPETEAFED